MVAASTILQTLRCYSVENGVHSVWIVSSDKMWSGLSVMFILLLYFNNQSKTQTFVAVWAVVKHYHHLHMQTLE